MNKGWKNKKTPTIVGTETAPTKMESGQVIINKKATKENLDKLIEINNDGLDTEKSKVSTDGTDGGILKGKAHYDKDGNSLGGIPVIVDGAKKIEVEGDEFVVNKEASQKHWKELSKINQSTGNGVPINPSDVGADDDPKEFRQGGTAKIEFNPNHIPNKWIYSYAKKIKEKYPKVWDMGGNIFGNEAFKNLERVVERGYWTDSEEWMYIKWQSYVARHHKDFRIAGTVAMLKWVDKTDKGWDYMKALIDKEVAKKYPKKGFKRKLSGGGGVNEGLQMINKTDEFSEKYDIIVNGIKQGSILKSDKEYFAMSNSTRGGKSFSSKRFDNLDKAKKYIYSKTKTIFPLNSKSIMNKMGYGEGGGVKIMPKQGTLLTKDKKLKLDYKKNGNNFEFVVYDGKTKPVANYTKTSFKKKENGLVTMDYNQFMNYIYAEGYIDDKNYDLGGGVEFVPEKKGTLIRGNEIIKYFEKVNGNYRLIFYTLNESKGKVPTMCDAFGYCEELDSENLTPKQLVELIKKNNLMEYGGGFKDITCKCGWNKNQSEKHDEYVCHKCGTDNKMKDGGEVDDKNKKWVTCPRCGGSGELELYRHINAGVCFECHGTGIVPNDKIKEIKEKMLLARKKYEEKSRIIAENQKEKDQRVIKRRNLVAKELNEKIIELRIKNTDLNLLLKRDDFQAIIRYAERKNAKNGEEFIEVIENVGEIYLKPYFQFLIEKYLREKYNYYGYLNFKEGINNLYLFDGRDVTKEQAKVERELQNDYIEIYDKIGRYDDDVIEDRPRGLDKMKDGGTTDDFDYMSLFEQSNDIEPTENIYEKEREEEYQKSNYSKRWASTFKEAVEKTVKSYLDAKATYEDWGSRQYKSNKGVVFAGGDDVHGNAYTIGGINEYRRKRTMAGAKMQMDEELETLKKLGLSQQEIADLIENKMENGGSIDDLIY
jgi:DNA-directed RNA polymerase subunit RPC12/RpoP